MALGRVLALVPAIGPADARALGVDSADTFVAWSNAARDRLRRALRLVADVRTRVGRLHVEVGRVVRSLLAHRTFSALDAGVGSTSARSSGQAIARSSAASVAARACQPGPGENQATPPRSMSTRSSDRPAGIRPSSAYTASGTCASASPISAPSRRSVSTILNSGALASVFDVRP